MQKTFFKLNLKEILMVKSVVVIFFLMKNVSILY